MNLSRRVVHKNPGDIPGSLYKCFCAHRDTASVVTLHKSKQLHKP